MPDERLNRLPRIHERERPVREAENELRSFIIELLNKHDLTTAESLRVITAACSGETLSILKYCIRQERHGNTETPGGLESQ